MNLISFLAVLWLLLPLAQAIYYRFSARNRYITIFLGALATLIVSEGLKYTIFSHIHRPAGAKDCNIFCNDGPQAGTPGFPSSHAATTTFLALSYSMDGSFTPLGAAIAWLLVILSRIYKKCHTWSQITAGTVLGAIIHQLVHSIIE